MPPQKWQNVKENGEQAGRSANTQEKNFKE